MCACVFRKKAVWITIILVGMVSSTLLASEGRCGLRSTLSAQINKEIEKEIVGSGKTKLLLTFISHVRDTSKVDFPLGISTITGSVKDKFGEKVNVAMVHNLIEGETQNVVDRIKKEKPDILGVSLGFGSLNDLSGIMKYVRSLPKDQRPLVVLGNLIAAYNAEILLLQYPEVIIARGLGEEAMKGIIDYHNGSIAKKDIPNVTYMENDTLIETKTILNEISKPYFDKAITQAVVESGGVMYLETSRGCPFNCKICDRKTFLAGGWRGQDLEELIDDIKTACSYGAYFINFVDEDIFAGGTQRLNELADRIIQAKQKGELPKELIFGSSVSVRNIYNHRKPEITQANLTALRKMHKAGLRVLFPGVESGAPAQLKRYGKAATVFENKEAIKIIEKMGIYTIPGFIMFDPFVTIEELKQNINFLRRTGMDVRITYPLKSYIPLKGSKLTDMFMAEGLLDKDSYMPARLSYGGYYYKEKSVATILKCIKDWENSQSMFFWELKIIFRSSKYGKVSKNEKRLIRKYIGAQTKILLDYLSDLVNLEEKQLADPVVLRKISDKYSIRLINDLISVLQAIHQGKMALGGDALKIAIYEGLVREVIRTQPSQIFSLEHVTNYIAENYHFHVDDEWVEKIFDKLVLEKCFVSNSDGSYSITSSFNNYANIPWADLPRPYVGEKDKENNISLEPLQAA